MPTTPAAPAAATVAKAIPQRLVVNRDPAREKHKSPGNPLIAASPIERAWAAGQPALSFSFRQPTVPWTSALPGDDAVTLHAQHGDRFRSRKGACLHPTCQRAVAEIVATGPRITDPSPFHTIDTRRSDPPPEATLARKAGYTMFSLDMPTSPADGASQTLAETVTAEHADITPYLVQDPETANQIQWEREAHYSGPTTYFRRKWSEPRQEDILVVDRAGTRLWWDRHPITGEAVQVFAAPKPYHYPSIVDAYIDRITELTGSFPSWDEQRKAKRQGAYDRAIRQQSPLVPPPDARLDPDPYRFRFHDAELHEPHEVIDVSELLTEDMALRFRTSLAKLLPEELDELEAEIIERLRTEGRDHALVIRDRKTGAVIFRLEPESLLSYTRYAVRNHGNWDQAILARLHSNGAEYLASMPDAIA